LYDATNGTLHFLSNLLNDIIKMSLQWHTDQSLRKSVQWKLEMLEMEAGNAGHASCGTFNTPFLPFRPARRFFRTKYFFIS
jgi:hypothetical protein